MAISKVIFGDTTLIDLTEDTVVAEKLLEGYTAHKSDGTLIEGSCTFDADTRDGTALASEILLYKDAYVHGSKLSGTMPNNGSVSGSISVKNVSYVIPEGYHDGTGSVQIDSNEQGKIIPQNIRQGVEILGILGTMSGSEDVKATSCNVTPYITAQTIIPSDLGDYNSITEVNVAAISYIETDNIGGGKTALIGTVAPSS